MKKERKEREKKLNIAKINELEREKKWKASMESMSNSKSMFRVCLNKAKLSFTGDFKQLQRLRPFIGSVGMTTDVEQLFL